MEKHWSTEALVAVSSMLDAGRRLIEPIRVLGTLTYMDECRSYDDPGTKILGDEEAPFWNAQPPMASGKDWKGSTDERANENDKDSAYADAEVAIVIITGFAMTRGAVCVCHCGVPKRRVQAKSRERGC